MSTLMKIMLVPALVVAFSVGVAIAASGGDSTSPLAQVAPPTSTIDTTTTTPTTTTRPTTTDEAEDVSGPCDEAEHAGDPRCTGVRDDRDDDNSGPGRGDLGDDDQGADDNSGPGSQHSGPGGADDDEADDDHGGHGG